MKKVIYMHSVHPNELLVLCPFVGWTIETQEDFVKLLKEHAFKNLPDFKGYPALRISLENGQDLVFTGHCVKFKNAPIRKDGKPYRWAIFNKPANGSPVKWIDIKEDWDYVFDRLPDKEKQDKLINSITKLVNASGGLTIEFK